MTWRLGLGLRACQFGGLLAKTDSKASLVVHHDCVLLLGLRAHSSTSCGTVRFMKALLAPTARQLLANAQVRRALRSSHQALDQGKAEDDVITFKVDGRVVRVRPVPLQKQAA